MGLEASIERLKQLTRDAVAAIEAGGSTDELEDLRVRFLGRKSELADTSRSMATLDDEGRKVLGKSLNEARDAIQSALGSKTSDLTAVEREHRLIAEKVDVTLPGRVPPTGRIHPISSLIEEIVDIFVGLGFTSVEGPIIETDYYNFEALNIPSDHSARSMHDTLYVRSAEPETVLVRTHTSPMQVRVMERSQPPVYVVVPGVVGRNETVDATHLAMFTQIEGLAVDEGITFADLKGTLEVFAKQMFGKDRRVRMHPSYFPFTEPSAEVYVSCFSCDGSGCAVCRKEGWIEVMGAGMVHPNVFAHVGYDSERYTGFAFGMGPERIAMLRYGVEDLRHFYENDLSFLEAF